MTQRPTTSAIIVVVLAVAMATGCGANVDKVKGAVPSSTTTAASSSTDQASPTTTSTPAETTPKSSKEEEPYVQAMAKSMTDDTDFPGTADQARCFATKSIGVIGVDRLKNKGITPDDLSSETSLDLSDVGLTMDEGNEIYDSLADCGIDLREMMMDSMGEGGEVPAEAKACLDQVLNGDNLRKLVVTSMVKGGDAVENDPGLKPIMSGLMGCMFMTMGSSSTTTP